MLRADGDGDGCNMRGHRARERGLEEGRLCTQLQPKIGETKTAVAPASGGSKFWVMPSGAAQVVKGKLADKVEEAFRRSIRQMTRRSGGRSLPEVAEQLRSACLPAVSPACADARCVPRKVEADGTAAAWR